MPNRGNSGVLLNASTQAKPLFVHISAAYRLMFVQEKEPNILFVIKYAYPPKNKVSITTGRISLSEK